MNYLNISLSYCSDTFDENTPPTDDPEYISSLGAAIFKGMQSGDDDAVWLMQVNILNLLTIFLDVYILQFIVRPNEVYELAKTRMTIFMHILSTHIFNEALELIPLLSLCLALEFVFSLLITLGLFCLLYYLLIFVTHLSSLFFFINAIDCFFCIHRDGFFKMIHIGGLHKWRSYQGFSLNIHCPTFE